MHALIAADGCCPGWMQSPLGASVGTVKVEMDPTYYMMLKLGRW